LTLWLLSWLDTSPKTNPIVCLRVILPVFGRAGHDNRPTLKHVPAKRNLGRYDTTVDNVLRSGGAGGGVDFRKALTMHCTHCGKRLDESAKFCAACGQTVHRQDKVEEPLQSIQASVADEIGTSPESPITTAPSDLALKYLPKKARTETLPGVEQFDLQAGAFGWFFRSVAVVMGVMLVIPAPWIICWVTRWAVSQVRLGNRGAPGFRGTPASVAVIALLQGLCFLVGWSAAFFDPQAQIPVLQVLNGVSTLAVYPLGWAYARWVINHTQFGERSLRFTGSVWAYMGWLLFAIVGIFTIIGWAWVFAAFHRWFAGHIQNAGGQVRFIGKGHQYLWRTLVFVLGCVPIVTIPWAGRWYLRWFTQQFELHRQASTSLATPTPSPVEDDRPATPLAVPSPSAQSASVVPDLPQQVAPLNEQQAAHDTPRAGNTVRTKSLWKLAAACLLVFCATYVGGNYVYERQDAGVTPDRVGRPTVENGQRLREIIEDSELPWLEEPEGSGQWWITTSETNPDAVDVSIEVTPENICWIRGWTADPVADLSSVQLREMLDLNFKYAFAKVSFDLSGSVWAHAEIPLSILDASTLDLVADTVIDATVELAGIIQASEAEDIPF
jgi:hypothetical protein